MIDLIAEPEFVKILYQVGPAPTLIAAELHIRVVDVHEALRRYDSFRTAYEDQISNLVQAIRDIGPNKSKIAIFFGVERYQSSAWIAENKKPKQVFSDADEGVVDLAKDGLIESLKRQERWAIQLVMEARGGYGRLPDIDKEAEMLGVNAQALTKEFANRIAGLITQGDDVDDDQEATS